MAKRGNFDKRMIPELTVDGFDKKKGHSRRSGPPSQGGNAPMGGLGDQAAA